MKNTTVLKPDSHHPDHNRAAAITTLCDGEPVMTAVYAHDAGVREDGPSYTLDTVIDAFVTAAVNDEEALEDVQGALAAWLERVEEMRLNNARSRRLDAARAMLVELGEPDAANWSPHAVISTLGDMVEKMREETSQ